MVTFGSDHLLRSISKGRNRGIRNRTSDHHATHSLNVTQSSSVSVFHHRNISYGVADASDYIRRGVAQIRGKREFPACGLRPIICLTSSTFVVTNSACQGACCLLCDYRVQVLGQWRNSGLKHTGPHCLC